jgi:transposase InsO family protein
MPNLHNRLKSAKVFQQFMGLNGIKHIKTTPYHPSSNGLAERFVQSFKQAMRASKNAMVCVDVVFDI